ncbi:hypothetical protein WOLCODRAFT_136625 [Wolfiporia cocos MD-104 SS10]|uniref:Transmembrane protein n=1 Tax=Wolfiporia cocos (strain MD-104) TaxID=742152 RepID=A0A2H3JER2_WOLCO|nr:hypothetical protein WOLCODRAFT_136625 [Wolfiporia cocos MD-104 SS10]
MSTRDSFLSTTGLIRAPSSVSTYRPARQAKPGGTKPEKTPKHKVPLTATRAGVIPLGPAFIVGIVVVFSLIFILSISCAFVGSEDDEPPFKSFLDDIATNNPGILLIGDNVDVDVDEPSITIRWSMLGCGSAFVLPGSEGTHGSSLCGIPSMPLTAFIDSSNEPAATYDPMQFPVVDKINRRLSIQDLCQFDSDHVLDVHQARLYPFDTYRLTSTLRLETANGTEAVALRALTTLKLTSSFAISPSDVESKLNVSGKGYVPSRDIVLEIRRPHEARLFAMLLFGASWMLVHVTIGFVAIAWLTREQERVVQSLFFTFIVLLAVPQLRNAMPDAPGYDGVLLDSIGFFPQMLCAGASAIVLSIMICTHGLRSLNNTAHKVEEKALASTDRRASKGLERLRRQGSSVDFRHLRSWSRAAFVGSPGQSIPESSAVV